MAGVWVEKRTLAEIFSLFLKAITEKLSARVSFPCRRRHRSSHSTASDDAPTSDRDGGGPIRRFRLKIQPTGDVRGTRTCAKGGGAGLMCGG